MKTDIQKKIKGNKDKLVIEDNNNDFIEFERDVIKIRHIKINIRSIDDGKVQPYIIQVVDVSKLKENKKRIFEFLAKNCENEFSYQIYENKKEFICTSFLKNAELSVAYLITKNTKLVYHVHSHPNEEELAPSPGDIKNATKFHKSLFEVYSPITGKYKKYDKFSTSYELEEVIISNKPKKKE